MPGPRADSRRIVPLKRRSVYGLRADRRQPFLTGLGKSCPLSGSVYTQFSQAYLRLLIGEIGGNSTKRPFRLPLDIATKLEKWIRPPKFFPYRKLLHVL